MRGGTIVPGTLVCLYSEYNCTGNKYDILNWNSFFFVYAYKCQVVSRESMTPMFE